MKIIVYIIAAWLCVSSIVYAIRHPEQTDTQRLLNFKEMLLFK